MAHPPPHAQNDAPRPSEPLGDVPTSRDMLDLLAHRRSLPLRALVDPGPDDAALAAMLAVAARVPDHGRLVPWRFILLKGAARAAAGDRLDALYGAQNPDLPPAKAGMWRTYLERAPVTVVLVSRPDRANKVPEFNQVLSAGAAGMALIAAATALGFGTQWLLKWPGRDPEAARILGVGPQERIAGFIHIGSPAERPGDRPRPALADVVREWRAPPEDDPAS